MDNDIVQVCRQIGGWDLASVKFSDVWGIHWSNRTGGYQNICLQWHLFGYIHPDNIIEGDVARSGRHNYDNGIKVVILKKNNTGIWDKLIERYGEQPKNYTRPEGQPPCSKKIIQIVNEKKSIKRTELRQQLLDIGYQDTTIRNAIKRLSKNKKISVVGTHWTNEVIGLMELD